MNNCCTQSGTNFKAPRKQTCPVNQHGYVSVSIKTILHHVKKTWNIHLKDQGYYFCDDPNCDVVYFGEDGSVIKKSELRTIVAAKENSPDTLICHCFGVSLLDVKKNPAIEAFVMQHTKLGNCSCETSNPSGRCCLKDFP